MNKPAAQNISSKKWQSDLQHIEEDNPNLIFEGSEKYKDILNSWNRYNEIVLLSGGLKKEELGFKRLKFGHVPKNLAIKLLKSLDSLPKRMYQRNDCVGAYVASRCSPEEVYKHRQAFSGFNFEKEQLALVKLICEEIKPDIEFFLKTGFKVINVKAQESVINPIESIGPNYCHLDGFPIQIHKILVYLTEAGELTGTTSFPNEALKDLARPKRVYAIAGPPGSFALFNPNIMHHQGMPGKEGRKVILEITVVPSYETEINPTFNGTNSRHPISPPINFSEKDFLRKAMTTKLNIGGGKREFKGWLNLDSIAHSPFYFKLDNKFPLKDNSQELVYSSHALEHIPQDVVDYILDETYRVLDGYKDFVIKIPDFDRVLQHWRAGNDEFFDKHWGLKKIIPTWKSKEVPDTIDYRCSMIFCGIWNNAYGDHFAKKIKEHPDAYHGPVPMPLLELKDLLSTGNPSLISSTLRAEALKQGDITFNHQTSWGKKEFADLLRSHKFFVRTYMDTKAILKEYSFIPGIKEMEEISLFVSCYKT